jgi:glycosyltransferase involved in cell wall biosynthesis
MREWSTHLTPRVSVVIPVHNEGAEIAHVIRRISESIQFEHEILIVYDSPDDSSIPVVNAISSNNNHVRGVLNPLGPGPAKAIRAGIHESQAPVVVVTMADGCDDPDQIPTLVKLVERGVVIAAASRYLKGGRQIGGPLLKSLISRLSGVSLYYLGRVGTRDATNSFKAYSRHFLQQVSVESKHGFELGIELVSKARRYRLPVAEIPTIWLDRTFGESKFKLAQWAPHYLRWYFYAFGPRLSKNQKEH